MPRVPKTEPGAQDGIDLKIRVTRYDTGNGLDPPISWKCLAHVSVSRTLTEVPGI